MKEVLLCFPQAQLVIAGEGKEKEALVGLTQGLGIAPNVLFIPNIDDTRQVLWALDIFVMPSLAEGLGLGLMEAMAAGIASIGSEVGGIISLIRNNENGLLAAPADAKGLALAITGLLRDAALRQRLAKNGQESILENFSQGKMVDATERVYAQCLQEKK